APFPSPRAHARLRRVNAPAYPRARAPGSSQLAGCPRGWRAGRRREQRHAVPPWHRAHRERQLRRALRIPARAGAPAYPALLASSRANGGQVPGGHPEAHRVHGELRFGLVDRMSRVPALVLLVALIPLPVLAAPFADPMRPPSASETPALAASGGPRLESVLIAPDRRIAVINGEQVSVGGRVGAGEVIRITESEVV